ncbi:hypothetical protein ANO11243_030890 [Dothideomycetidae sp. 11243]|nr:hypothetical protein ANO11243_030890 [fungal sp. No.11243]
MTAISAVARGSYLSIATKSYTSRRRRKRSLNLDDEVSQTSELVSRSTFRKISSASLHNNSHRGHIEPSARSKLTQSYMATKKYRPKVYKRRARDRGLIRGRKERLLLQLSDRLALDSLPGLLDSSLYTARALLCSRDTRRVSLKRPQSARASSFAPQLLYNKRRSQPRQQSRANDVESRQGRDGFSSSELQIISKPSPLVSVRRHKSYRRTPPKGKTPPFMQLDLTSGYLPEVVFKSKVSRKPSTLLDDGAPALYAHSGERLDQPTTSRGFASLNLTHPELEKSRPMPPPTVEVLRSSSQWLMQSEEMDDSRITSALDRSWLSNSPVKDSCASAATSRNPRAHAVASISSLVQSVGYKHVTKSTVASPSEVSPARETPQPLRSESNLFLPQNLAPTYPSGQSGRKLQILSQSRSRTKIRVVPSRRESKLLITAGVSTWKGKAQT